MLGLALRQDTSLKGLDAPGLPGETHLFSVFVDESTLFFAKAGQITHAFSIIYAFGALSGLQVQPTTSKIIFLNREITIECYAGGERSCRRGALHGTVSGVRDRDGGLGVQELGHSDPEDPTTTLNSYTGCEECVE